jgi:hypothetical protein
MGNTRQVSIQGAPNPEFDIGFQYQVVAHMARDEGFFRTNVGWLQVELFSRVECQLVLQAMYDFFSAYRTIPSLPTMELYLRDTIMPSGVITWTQEDLPALCSLLEHIHRLSKLESEFYQQKMQQFVREVKVYELMREAQEQGFGNQADAVLGGLEQIRRDNAHQGGIRISSASADDPELIMTREQQIRVPTGLMTLDKHLAGGLAPKEIGMVTACTGVGKTNALINFGLSAAVSGWRSLIITAEVPQPKMKRRFQAMATNITADYFKQAIRDWPEDVVKEYMFFVQPEYRFSGLDSFADLSNRRPSVAQIEEMVVMWKEQTFERYGAEEAEKCRLVCFDWLDRIESKGVGISQGARSDEILTEYPYLLGEIARRQDVGLWTATQGTREADGQEVLNLKHTSGAYHKNDGLDVSLGLGRVNDDDTYGDVEEYAQVVNEDDDSCPPVDRDLVFSLMKGRESSMAGCLSFKFYQGASLRFWNSKHDMERLKNFTAEERLLQGMGQRKERVAL